MLGSGQFLKPDAKVLEQAIGEAELIEGRTALPLEEVLSFEAVEEHIKASKSWAGRMGANSLIPPVFINGLSLAKDEVCEQFSVMEDLAETKYYSNGCK